MLGGFLILGKGLFQKLKLVVTVLQIFKNTFIPALFSFFMNSSIIYTRYRNFDFII